MPVRIVSAVLMLVLAVPALAQDNRQYVDMPAHMRDHMLGNMRDHLLALQSITRQLAEGRYDEAADVAEARLGMSSLQSHGASHMAQFMPKDMSETGTAMHRAASRFAVAARDAAVEGGLAKAFGALSEVMQQCVACHSAYRVH
jgi:cytochrome c556